MADEEKDDRLLRERRYKLAEHRDGLRRVLAKVIGRRVPGKVEIKIAGANAELWREGVQVASCASGTVTCRRLH